MHSCHFYFSIHFIVFRDSSIIGKKFDAILNGVCLIPTFQKHHLKYCIRNIKQYLLCQCSCWWQVHYSSNCFSNSFFAKTELYFKYVNEFSISRFKSFAHINRMKTFRLYILYCNFTNSIKFNSNFGFHIDIFKNGKEWIRVYNDR